MQCIKFIRKEYSSNIQFMDVKIIHEPGLQGFNLIRRRCNKMLKCPKFHTVARVTKLNYGSCFYRFYEECKPQVISPH